LASHNPRFYAPLCLKTGCNFRQEPLFSRFFQVLRFFFREVSPSPRYLIFPSIQASEVLPFCFRGESFDSIFFLSLVVFCSRSPRTPPIRRMVFQGVLQVADFFPLSYDDCHIEQFPSFFYAIHVLGDLGHRPFPGIQEFFDPEEEATLFPPAYQSLFLFFLSGFRVVSVMLVFFFFFLSHPQIRNAALSFPRPRRSFPPLRLLSSAGRGSVS